MSSEVKIGVIGCARILNAHLRGFRILQEKGFGDHFRITALCARKEEDAHRFRKRGEGLGARPAPVEAPGDPLNAPHMYISDLHPDQETAIYTDYRDMLRSGDVDAVVIYTGHDTHHSIAIDALKAGKHVAVEKPMAISVKAAQRMCEVANQTGRVLSIDENAHFSPATQASAWAIQQGLIGQVQMLYQGVMGFSAHRPDLVAARTPWRQSRLGAGGGVSIDLGVHLFNRVRTMCGPVKTVQALWRTIEPVRILMDEKDSAVVEEIENQVDDAFFANFEFDSGAMGHMAVSRSTHGIQIGVPGGTNIFGSAGALSGGKIYAKGQTSDAVGRFKANASREELDRVMPSGISDGFALEQLDWLHAIRDKRPATMSGEEGVVDLALSYGILESGELGRSVTLQEVLNGEVRAYQKEIDDHYGLS
ncbi:MAG: Gfo/Idh/MocA family oxidoreductase [bacterium]|nr:Gfo/Idh/MocA family oxidoreductase [bacterium]